MADFLTACELIARDPKMPDLTVRQYALLNILSRYDSVDYIVVVTDSSFNKPVVTRAITILERAGWLARRQDPTDGRKRVLALTSSGKDIVARLRNAGDGLPS